jgi:hypothetical protein
MKLGGLRILEDPKRAYDDRNATVSIVRLLALPIGTIKKSVFLAVPRAELFAPAFDRVNEFFRNLGINRVIRSIN